MLGLRGLSLQLFGHFRLKKMPYFLDISVQNSLNYFIGPNFSANDVDIMVFEPSVSSPPPQFGGIDDMV